MQMSQNLDALGFTAVPFGQGFEGKIQHGGNKVLSWMVDNIRIRSDLAGNIKPDKQKSTEKIEGIVALIMPLELAIRNGIAESVHSVHDERILLMIIGNLDSFSSPHVGFRYGKSLS